jgi:two-component system, cell cycle sensor histidine kinase and response regulator CckA
MKTKGQHMMKNRSVGRLCCAQKVWRGVLMSASVVGLAGPVLLRANQASPPPGAPALSVSPMVAQTDGAFWQGDGFMTNIRDVSLGLTSVLLLAALGWSISLRSRVKEQAVRIRMQLLRETALEEDYRDLFENANDMVFALDPNGKVTSLNKAGETILGCSREMAASRKLQEFVVPAQLEAYQQWLTKALAGTALPPFELELTGQGVTRSTLEVNVRAHREREKTGGVKGIARDITRRKEAEAALRESEERFSSAFRASPVAIAIAGLTDGRYIDVNNSFLSLFGYQHDEVIQRTSADLKVWASDEDRLKIEELFRQNRSVSGAECSFRVRSGEIRSGLVFAERIDLGGNPCALTILHDMTERLTLEDQLRKASKMEAIGRLAAGVAHDFNNLLMIIQGNADWALFKNSKNPDMARALDRISQAAQRASNLTRQLLTFSRKQNLQPKLLELNDLVNNATKMFKHLLRDDIDLRFKFAANLPMVKADPTMIEQAIMNLVVNARDAMPRGGELTVGTAFVQVDEAYRRSHSEAFTGDFVCLNVTDTGCGMDAATQARIFEPFFTTKEVGKGTGLGLATVYGVVKQHHGWIDLTSEIGKGTTFKLFFPAEHGTEKVVSSPAATSQPISDAPTILLVEDEPALVELVRTFLQEEGYRTLEASDGLTALQIWNDNRGQIDLLLTDINMPHGMSGIDLADNLRALKPELKVIYSSGHSPDMLNFEIKPGRNETFLAKPFSGAKLLQAVAAALSEPKLAAA